MNGNGHAEGEMGEHAARASNEHAARASSEYEARVSSEYEEEKIEEIGATVPAWVSYALGVLALGIALATPWVVRWQGLLRGEVPPLEDHEPRPLRPVMVWLPGGEFWMGSREAERKRFLDSEDDPTVFDDEGPQHRVTITRFGICQTEVTQLQWKAVMETEPSDCDNGCGDELPVQNVSWFDAIEYLNQLSRLQNYSVCYERDGDSVRWVEDCTGYRLPTEAEWEYAARAGSHTAFGFGDEVSGLTAYAWYDENSGGKAHEVQIKRSNDWALHDMHGNVWEWVWDWYGDYSAGAQTDPKGPETGENRVLRGGGFFNWARYLRSADRDWSPPSYSLEYVGFRCARGWPPALGD